MPLFELEKDGRIFEVEAPDMQTAVGAIGAIGDERSIGGFLSNLATNVGQVATSLAGAATQPVETAKHLGKLGVGMVQQFIPGQQEFETTHADPFYRQLGRDIGFRRGPEGIEWDPAQLARNLYERPADLALDVSAMVAPFGGLPGRAGAVARIADPINVAGRAVSTVAKTPARVARFVAGETTGLGPTAVSEAFRAGRVGGTEGEAFRSQMRGIADPELPVDLARGAVAELRRERGALYRSGITGIARDTTPLNFAPIDAAFADASKIQRFGTKDLAPSTMAVRQEMQTVLDDWRGSNPAEYHTAIGLDALKQRIADIGERFPFGSPERKSVGTVTAAIKDQIVKQAPEYAGVMKAYEQASRTIDELTRSLSLGKKTTYDTALRKLQSVLRNNAFTNWSARAKLAEIVQKKVPELMPSLAGQAASTFTPRGLPAKLLSGGAGIAGVTAAIIANPLALIPMFAGMAASSPRLLGEAVHGAGRAAGVAQRAAARVPPTAKAVGRTALATTPQIEAMKHAETVLSPEVLDHVKQAATTRPQLVRWLRARNAGQGVEEATQSLAEAIAAEVRRPELSGRIAAELSQTQGP